MRFQLLAAILFLSPSLIAEGVDHENKAYSFVPCSECDAGWTLAVAGPGEAGRFQFTDTDGFINNVDQPVAVHYSEKFAVVTGSENRYDRLAVLDFSKKPKVVEDFTIEEAVPRTDHKKWAILLASGMGKAVADNVVLLDLDGNTLVRHVFSCKDFGEKVNERTAVFGLNWMPQKSGFVFFEAANEKYYLVVALGDGNHMAVSRVPLDFTLFGKSRVTGWKKDGQEVEVSDPNGRKHNVLIGGKGNS